MGRPCDDLRVAVPTALAARDSLAGSCRSSLVRDRGDWPSPGGVGLRSTSAMLSSLRRGVLNRDSARASASADRALARRPRATEGRFVRQASVLALGTILGQVGVLAAAPLLTRIYSPEAIGAWAFFSTIAMALANIGNFKYEQAIVLPRSDARAVNLAALCLLVHICVLSLAAIAIVLVQSHAAGGFFDSLLSLGMVWLLLPLISALSFYSICRYWLLRKQQFRTLAVFIVLDAWLLSGAQIAAGITMGAGATPLVLAGVAAISTLALVFGIAVTLQMRSRGGRLSAAHMVALAKRYRNFPLYAAPYAFLGMASSRALLILFGILRDAGGGRLSCIGDARHISAWFPGFLGSEQRLLQLGVAPPARAWRIRRAHSQCSSSHDHPRHPGRRAVRAQRGMAVRHGVRF